CTSFVGRTHIAEWVARRAIGADAEVTVLNGLAARIGRAAHRIRGHRAARLVASGAITEVEANQASHAGLRRAVSSRLNRARRCAAQRAPRDNRTDLICRAGIDEWIAPGNGLTERILARGIGQRCTYMVALQPRTITVSRSAGLETARGRRAGKGNACRARLAIVEQRITFRPDRLRTSDVSTLRSVRADHPNASLLARATLS
ncbi:MAG: hypothetical protein AAFQ99_14235, partial [Pseudomonadota bacterium]